MSDDMTKILQADKNDVINLAADTIKIGKQSIVFFNNRRSTEKNAEDIAKSLAKKAKVKGFVNDELQQISDAILDAIPKPTKQCQRLALCAQQGVVFHHSGLVAKQRSIIEDAFREGKIKVICSTTTLALGLDLPAYRVVLKDLKRFGQTEWGYSWIPVLEYLQMSGRAGRPKFDNIGESICIARDESEKEDIEDIYIKGEPENIFSKLAVEPVLRTYILSLIATEFVKNKEELFGFFEKTFWAYQYKDMGKLASIINRMLSLLEDFGFIRIGNRVKKNEKDEKNENDGSGKDIDAADLFETAADIAQSENSDERIRATLLGKRVAQLYIDPVTAHHLIKCIRRSPGHMVYDFPLLQMVCNTLEIRPLLKIKAKEMEEINERYLEFESDLLDREPPIFEHEYETFMNSVKTALFLQDWVSEIDEEVILEKYNVRPGETRAKIDRADWLLYAAEELARLMQFQQIIKEIVKLRMRLKYGVKEELLPLLKLKNIGRVRARKMFGSGIKTIGDVKKANIATLSQLIGKATAISVKRQVGEDIIEAVSERKRKGQMGLGKY